MEVSPIVLMSGIMLLQKMIYILLTILLLMSGGQWGKESGAINIVVETDHHNPYAMLNYLKEQGLLE